MRALVRIARASDDTQQGIAIMEVLVALSIFAAMSTGVFLAFRGGMTAWVTTAQYAGEQQNARMLVTWMARYVRMIGYNYTGTNPAVIYGTPNEVDFYADIDNTGTPQCYRFYLSNGVVYQAKVTGTGCAGSIVSATGTPVTAGREAKALTFTEMDLNYYSAADLGGGQLTSNPLSSSDRYLVRRIDITAKVQGQSTTETPFVVHTESVVRAGR